MSSAKCLQAKVGSVIIDDQTQKTQTLACARTRLRKQYFMPLWAFHLKKKKENILKTKNDLSILSQTSI